MSIEFEFALHLLTAAVGSYALVLLARKLLEAIDAGLEGTLSTRSPWKEIGTSLKVALPVLPMVPSGIIFMMWPSEMVLAEPLYRFLTGAVAGSVASNLYELVVRALRARAKALLAKNGDQP